MTNRLQIVILRFVTGSRDAAFCGFGNTLRVRRKPLRSKGSGIAMAAFLEVVRRAKNNKEEARNGRMSGATANRQAERRFRKIEPAVSQFEDKLAAVRKMEHILVH